jgi:hypothetical protein
VIKEHPGTSQARAEVGSPSLAVAALVKVGLNCADNRDHEVGTCGSSPGMLVYKAYGRRTRELMKFCVRFVVVIL